MTDLESPEQPRKRRLFYGWWLALLAGLVMMLAIETVPNSMGIWVLPLNEESAGRASPSAPGCSSSPSQACCWDR